MNNLLESVTTILIAIVGVATLAVILSRKSNTTAVIQAAASGFSNSLGVALTPITDNPMTIDTSYPNSSMGSLSGFGGRFQ